MRKHRTMPGGAGAHRLIAAAAAVLAISACNLDRVLKVDLPGVVTSDQLNDPARAATLDTGVIADVECSWDSYVAAAALQSDQFIQSSNNMQGWGLRQVESNNGTLAQGSCQDWYGLFTPLQTARVQAEDVFKRLKSFDDARVKDKPRLLAEVRAYGGFPLIAFAEGFCSTAFDGGPELQPADVLALAEERFTEAIALARTAGSADILAMAYGGRARVRLDREDFQGAMSDAAQVPQGYVKWATRDASGWRRMNQHYRSVNGPDARHGSVAPNFRALTWKGVPDTRVVVTSGDRYGADRATPWYYHQKTPEGFATPDRLASYKEARLIMAEASARLGDLATARKLINAMHTDAGIPGVDVADAPTQDDVIRLVLEERNREMFAEGGYRLNDHLRFRATKFNIPFKGEPGSYFPNGVDQMGFRFGTTTCFPLPDVEIAGNPNIHR